MNEPRIFLITGAGTGLGRTFAEAALRAGHSVVGRVRREDEWAGRSMVRSGRSIADYDAVFDPVRRRRHDYSGRQAGDPAKAAQALLRVVESERPPVHLLLGRDALELAGERLVHLRDEIKAWEPVSLSTDFS